MDQQITVSGELLRQVLDATTNLSLLFERTREWGCLPIELVAARASEKALRAMLEQPVQEPEMHDAKCPALIGGDCECSKSPAFVDKPWARFCGQIGRGQDAPYPGMIDAFEQHYSQSFTDRDWRNEASVWAAAWKAAKAHTAPQAQHPEGGA